MALDITETAPHMLLIVTDQYAGNFEREMCAFLTGGIGECGVGAEEAALFDTWAEKNRIFKDICRDVLSQEFDERGCARPAAIANISKGGRYYDVAIFFEKTPTEPVLDVIRARMKLLVDYMPLVNVLRMQLIERDIKVSEVTTELEF